MKRHSQIFPASLIVMLLLISNSFAGGSLILRNARLIDGTGAHIQERVSILILDGRIVEIGKDLSQQGIRELDVQGSYVLPGLIDSHVHLMWGPGVAINDYKITPDKNTWNDTWGKNISHYLRAYLACGVTTVLDAGAPAFAINDIRSLLDKDNPGPRFLTLGEFFSPPRGYGADLFGSVSSREEVETKLVEMKALQVMGIKVPIEKGWNPLKDFPLHTQETLAAIKQGAAQRGLSLYVHASTEEAFNTTLAIQAHALMHTLIYRKEKQLSKRPLQASVSVAPICCGSENSAFHAVSALR